MSCHVMLYIKLKEHYWATHQPFLVLKHIGADIVGLGPIPIFSSGAHPAKNSQIIRVSRICRPTMARCHCATKKNKEKHECM